MRILYLRDFERLQEAYTPTPSVGETRLRTTLFAERDVEIRVAALAEQLIAAWNDRADDGASVRPLLLGVGQGSERFLATLAERVRARGVAVDVSRTDLTSYAGAGSAPRARITRPPSLPVAGRPVVILQEVLSTGLTAAFLESWLRRNGAAAVDVCALLDREAARILDVPLITRGFAAPDVALAGYGLSRWREYRHLPFIAELETD